MSRTAEVLWLGIGRNAHTRSQTALFCGDTGSSAYVVYRDRESCAVVIGVVIDHLRKVEFPAEFSAHRHTDQTFCVSRHEIYVFGSSEPSGAYHIAFIFAVLVIGNEDYLAVPEGIESLLDGVILEIFRHIFLLKS